MMATAGGGWQFLVLGGAVLACQATGAPSPEAAGSALERSAAGAGVVIPAAGGASSETSGLGGNAPTPAAPGRSGLGGDDVGAGGSLGGAAGSASDGGRDGDSQSSEDEVRYAILLDERPSGDVSRSPVSSTSP